MIKAYARLRETAAKSTPLRDNTNAIVAEAKKIVSDLIKKFGVKDAKLVSKPHYWRELGTEYLSTFTIEKSRADADPKYEAAWDKLEDYLDTNRKIKINGLNLVWYGEERWLNTKHSIDVTFFLAD